MGNRTLAVRAAYGSIIAASVIWAATAQAAPIALTCKVAGNERMTVYMTDGSTRPLDATVDLTETYQIDLPSKSVSRTLRKGTRYADKTTAVDDGAGYFTDVKAMSPTLVVFCADQQFNCAETVKTVNTATATGKSEPVILDLSRGTIAYSRRMSVTDNTTGRLSLTQNYTYSGTCNKA